MVHSGPSLLAASGRSGQKQKLTQRTSAPGLAVGAPRYLRQLSRMHFELTRMIGRPGTKDEAMRTELIRAAQAIKAAARRFDEKPT